MLENEIKVLISNIYSVFSAFLALNLGGSNDSTNFDPKPVQGKP